MRTRGPLSELDRFVTTLEPLEPPTKEGEEVEEEKEVELVLLELPLVIVWSEPESEKTEVE